MYLCTCVKIEKLHNIKRENIAFLILKPCEILILLWNAEQGEMFNLVRFKYVRRRDAA